MGQTSALTTAVNGLNIDDSIVSTGSYTGTGLAGTIDISYLINSRPNQGYGLGIANIAGGNGKLTISNNSSNVASITVFWRRQERQVRGWLKTLI